MVSWKIGYVSLLDLEATFVKYFLFRKRNQVFAIILLPLFPLWKKLLGITASFWVHLESSYCYEKSCPSPFQFVSSIKWTLSKDTSPIFISDGLEGFTPPSHCHFHSHVLLPVLAFRTPQQETVRPVWKYLNECAIHMPCQCAGGLGSAFSNV